MKQRFYLDSSIWIDIYENRKGYNDEPLGRYGAKLLILIKSSGCIIAISDFLVEELERYYPVDEITGMLRLFEGKIEKILLTREEKEEAKILAIEHDVPEGDAIHAILARDHDLVLVTRDNHFKRIEKVWRHYLPEELI
jgi:predicted nucleic acid-binding protein